MIIDPYTWTRTQIIALDTTTLETIAVHLRRPTGYTFAAGQYCVTRITLPDGERLVRQYSFVSAPGEANISLLIQREPAGVVSNWFHDVARPGAELELSQALGNFTLINARRRNVVLIAGKVGIAPFLSMLRAGNHKAQLVYSVKTSSQICYADELARYDTHILTTATSPRIDSTLLMPYMADSPVWYVCGSKQFVDAICVLLGRLGIPRHDIRRELFTLQ